MRLKQGPFIDVGNEKLTNIEDIDSLMAGACLEKKRCPFHTIPDAHDDRSESGCKIVGDLPNKRLAGVSGDMKHDAADLKISASGSGPVGNG